MSQFKTTGRFKGGLPVEALTHETVAHVAKPDLDEQRSAFAQKWAAEDAQKRIAALHAAIPDRVELQSLINSARSALKSAEVLQYRAERKHSDVTHPALRKARDRVIAAAKTVGVLHGDKHTIQVSSKGARYYVNNYGKKVYIK